VVVDDADDAFVLLLYTYLIVVTTSFMRLFYLKVDNMLC